MKYIFIALLFIAHNTFFAMLFFVEFLWDFKITKYEKFDLEKIKADFNKSLNSSRPEKD